jgi:hypothetical protein
VSLLAEARRLELALALLRRRARISIVHRETGLPRKRLRALYLELNGETPSCGPLPALGGARIANRALQIQAGLFAGIYARYVSGETGGALAALISAYDLYRALAPPERPLDINDAWVIAGDLRIGTSRLCTCARCGLHYLVASDSRLRPTCPFCVCHGRLARRLKRATRGRPTASCPAQPPRP